MDEKDDIFKANLIALFYQFRDRPHLLANYFIQHDALKDLFMERIAGNTKLASIYEEMKNNQDVQKPYFHNLEEMQKYYNSLFEHEGRSKNNLVHPVLGASTQEEALRKQLAEALLKEDYEKAAKLRDYMKELGIAFE